MLDKQFRQLIFLFLNFTLPPLIEFPNQISVQTFVLSKSVYKISSLSRSLFFYRNQPKQLAFCQDPSFFYRNQSQKLAHCLDHSCFIQMSPASWLFVKIIHFFIKISQKNWRVVQIIRCFIEMSPNCWLYVQILHCFIEISPKNWIIVKIPHCFIGISPKFIHNVIKVRQTVGMVWQVFVMVRLPRSYKMWYCAS